MKTDAPSRFRVVILLAVSVACTVYAGKPQDVHIQMTDGSVMSGTAIWKPASQAYLLKSAGAGNITKTLQARDVAAVKPAVFPPELRQIMQAIDSGANAASQIPKLERIADDWEMMGADLIAISYLARGYLQVNQTDKAVSMCEDLFRKNPMTRRELAVQKVYWEALLKADNETKLKRALDSAVQEGNRSTQAAALVMRGDMLSADSSKTRDSLIDGYLRVIVFYQSEKTSYEEALFKAAEAHAVLNEHHYAEKWRVQLRAKFPAGRWTQKLTS